MHFGLDARLFHRGLNADGWFLQDRNLQREFRYAGLGGRLSFFHQKPAPCNEVGVRTPDYWALASCPFDQ
jgi:hypothetical protein